jgi:membrane-associated phospholipid phosphatase
MIDSFENPVRWEWYWVPAAVCLFAALIIQTAGLNQKLFLAVHQAGWSIPPVLWQLVTFLGGTLTALALLLLATRMDTQLVWSAFLAGLISFAWSHALKIWLDVPRPPAVFGPEMLHVIGPKLRHGSFPSGHTTTAFTMAGIVAFHLKRWPGRLSLVILAALVGLSRIAVGVHWPLDVLVGAGGGWLTAGAGHWLGRKWPAGRKVRRVLLILLILCAAALPFVDSRYPAARWLALGIALITVPAGLFTLRAAWHGED